MPALNYDYDYIEYRNGRRVGSAVAQVRPASTNRTYSTPRTATTRRTTSQVARPTTRVNSTTQNVTNRKKVATKQTTTKGKVAVKKAPNTKSTSVKKSKIDIPLEPSKKIAKKPEAMNLKATKASAKTNSSSTLKNLALVSVFFCLFFMVCYRYSLINEQFSSIKTLKNDLVKVQTANEQLQADIESKTDLTYVENYAKYQLGMQKPTSSQIQYVSVEKRDKITTPVTIDEGEDLNWFENIINEIRKIID